VTTTSLQRLMAAADQQQVLQQQQQQHLVLLAVLLLEACSKGLTGRTSELQQQLLVPAQGSWLACGRVSRGISRMPAWMLQLQQQRQGKRLAL
jgi:hypothetical protein